MSKSELVHIKWDYVMESVQRLAARISAEHDDIEELVCIARGGMVIGCLLSYALPLRTVHTVSSIRYSKIEKTIEHNFNLPQDMSAQRKILLVDDLVDKGVTMDNIKKDLARKHPNLEVITCTLSIKDSADTHPVYYPDYYAHTYDYGEWLVYPWETLEDDSSIG